jgi:hypothetical protein
VGAVCLVPPSRSPVPSALNDCDYECTCTTRRLGCPKLPKEEMLLGGVGREVTENLGWKKVASESHFSWRVNIILCTDLLHGTHRKKKVTMGSPTWITLIGISLEARKKY